MASELTLIHRVPPGCDDREFLSELRALLWINYRYYLAPLFWFVVGGPWGPITLIGYCVCCAPGRRGWRVIRRRAIAYSRGLMPFCTWCGLGYWYVWSCGLCAGGTRGKSLAGLVCFFGRPSLVAVPGSDPTGLGRCANGMWDKVETPSVGGLNG